MLLYTGHKRQSLQGVRSWFLTERELWYDTGMVPLRTYASGFCLCAANTTNPPLSQAPWLRNTKVWQNAFEALCIGQNDIHSTLDPEPSGDNDHNKPSDRERREIRKNLGTLHDTVQVQ